MSNKTSKLKAKARAQALIRWVRGRCNNNLPMSTSAERTAFRTGFNMGWDARTNKLKLNTPTTPPLPTFTPGPKLRSNTLPPGPGLRYNSPASGRPFIISIDELPKNHHPLTRQAHTHHLLSDLPLIKVKDPNEDLLDHLISDMLKVIRSTPMKPKLITPASNQTITTSARFVYFFPLALLHSIASSAAQAMSYTPGRALEEQGGNIPPLFLIKIPPTKKDPTPCPTSTKRSELPTFSDILKHINLKKSILPGNTFIRGKPSHKQD